MLCNQSGYTKTYKAAGIRKLIQSAEERGDEEVHLAIIDNSKSGSVNAHQSCYCTYTSKEKIQRIKNKRKSDGDNSNASPRKTRLMTQSFRSPNLGHSFDFKTLCIFCGQECLPVNIKHPDRWDRVVECMTNERSDIPSFRQTILDIADQRNDDAARRVKYHASNVIDLPGADAQYHLRCYRAFVKVPKHSELSSVSDDACEDALNAVLSLMHADRSRLWNSIELHKLYVENGGDLSRRAMLSNLTNCLGDDGILLRVNGCAPIVGFKDTVGSTIQMVKADDSDYVDDLVRKIRTEARSMKYDSANYDLSQFTRTSTIENTSPTLLKLVAELVSGGEVTKKAVCLSQAIQSHVTSTRNQTTLGLAVKLHHHHGSSELVRTLHEFGFSVSYDEVRRFKKSAAKLIGDDKDILYKFVGLNSRVGIISGWFDNLDLQVCTPNGQRNTHVMVQEFQQPHPAGILHTGRACPGECTLVIP